MARNPQQESVQCVLQGLSRFSHATVYFLGASDTGKSSLISEAATQLCSANTAVLDADIGQSTVLPLTISLLRARPHADGGPDLEIVRWEFMPGFNLVRHCERNALIMKSLVRDAQGWAAYRLIDTTGFVEGAGVMVKKRELEATEPDLVVALQRCGELEPIVKDLRCECLCLLVTPDVRARSREERRARRDQKLREYFQDATVRHIRAEAVLPGAPENKRGLLVGLYSDGLAGLGRVEEVTGEGLAVLTPVQQPVEKVEFATVRFPG